MLFLLSAGPSVFRGYDPHNGFSVKLVPKRFSIEKDQFFIIDVMMACSWGKPVIVFAL